MSARTYTPDEIIRAVVRRRWVLLVPFAIGVAATPLLAPFAPERYRSDTLILVIPQRVPDSYVKTTVTESVEDRLPAITEQILSRSRLERIVQEMNLYGDRRKKQVMEDVVAQMRLDVKTSVVGSKEGADSFRVEYVNEDAETARKVTERLASLYIEQNTSDRESQAENTSQFLASQLEEAKRRLIEQEKKLEDYKKRNSGQLPTQLLGNLQSIQNASSQLQSLSESTNRALERRLLIERQTVDLQAVPLQSTRSVTTAQDAPAGSSTAEQLEAARARLAAYSQRYTPDHPEVISLERTVAELASRLEGETPLGTSAKVVERPLSPEEAAQKRKLLDLQAELAVVDLQLAANRTEDQRLKQVIAAYQGKVDAVPTRESELVELTRDYGTLQLAYTNLLMKKEDSTIAANLERRKIGEQFRIIDPASRPERPYNQRQRIMVMGSGAAAGLVFGLLLLAILEYRDSSFRREEEVYRSLSLPVLAMIPMMTSQRERRADRRRSLVLDMAGSVLLVAATAVLVFWKLRS